MYYDSIPSSWLPVIAYFELEGVKGEVVEWFRGEEGDVSFDEPLCRIEWSLDITLGGWLEISSPAPGLLHIVKKVGDRVDNRDNIVAYIEPRYKA